MITLSELQSKEVIMISSGKRLGFIDDLEIDEEKGKITALILIERQQNVSIFNKSKQKMIQWQQIIIIGEDVILINEWDDIQKKLPNHHKMS